jgi:hypothetical protein
LIAGWKNFLGQGRILDPGQSRSKQLGGGYLDSPGKKITLSLLPQKVAKLFHVFSVAGRHLSSSNKGKEGQDITVMQFLLRFSMTVVEHDHADFPVRYPEFSDDIGDPGSGRIFPDFFVETATAQGCEQFDSDLHKFSESTTPNPLLIKEGA